MDWVFLFRMIPIAWILYFTTVQLTFKQAFTKYQTINKPKFFFNRNELFILCRFVSLLLFRTRLYLVKIIKFSFQRQLELTKFHTMYGCTLFAMIPIFVYIALIFIYFNSFNFRFCNQIFVQLFIVFKIHLFCT